MQFFNAMHEPFCAPSPSPEFHGEDRSLPRRDAALLSMLIATNRLKRALHQDAVEILDTVGLTVLQWMILWHLRHAEAATLTEIATRIHHDAGALSRAAHMLQQRSLVTAIRLPHDRRTVRLSISETGRALCSFLDMNLGDRLNRTLDTALGSSAIQALLELMERAATSLDSA